MEQEVDFIGVLACFSEKLVDFLIRGHIAGKKRGVFTEGSDEVFDLVLQAFALVVENQFGTGVRPGLGDGPGDAFFIGDTEDEGGFTA